MKKIYRIFVIDGLKLIHYHNEDFVGKKESLEVLKKAVNAGEFKEFVILEIYSKGNYNEQQTNTETSE